MTTHRFMIPVQDINAEQGTVRISDTTQIKQVTRVLRLGIGSHIEIIDGHGHVYRCQITRAKRDVVEAMIIENIGAAREHAQPDPETQIKVTVVLSLLKGTQFKTALSKLTEIGVHKIVPVIASRTVVASKNDAEDGDDSSRMRRWMSIIREATEQCERSVSPYMVNVRTLAIALNELRDLPEDASRRIFICTERREAPHLIRYLYNDASSKPSPVVPLSDIYIIIGPEGGFTAEEIDLALSIGCAPCSLGPTILRAETAAIFAASLVSSFGEILCTGKGISP